MSEASGPSPRRARLELLVRKPEDDGFEVREIRSATAFLQSRPQRVPAASDQGREIRLRLRELDAERQRLVTEV